MTRRWPRLTLVIALLLVAWGGLFVYDIFHTPNDENSAPQTVTIASGASAAQVARQLGEAGILQRPLNFHLYLTFRGRTGDIIAGTYELTPQSVRRLANTLTSGPQPTERTVTLIEGWTNQQVAEALQKAFDWPSTDPFLAATRRLPAEHFDFLDSKPSGVDLEGYLFPDTYRFYADATPTDIVTALLETFDRRVDADLRAAMARQGRTLHETLTLASIVEREVPTPADRRIVADIFWRRLDAGIALQADSTVNYLTGKKTPSISAADRAIQSPYNTYQVRGLPPGPIGNPGLDAVQAATQPTPNSYWYFLTTPDGDVIYSRTFAEHVAAKQKYLR